jgi:heme exporter protein A
MLEAHDLAARRGTARLFAGLGFAVAAATRSSSPAPTDAARRRCSACSPGLSIPEAGEIRLDGAAVRAFSPALRAAVTFAGHALALKDEMSARENLLRWSRSVAHRLTTPSSTPRSIASRSAIASACPRACSRRASGGASGSRGWRLSRRRVWILDEPVTALDAVGAALLGDLVARHLERGGLVVASTHAPLALPPARVRTLSLD